MTKAKPIRAHGSSRRSVLKGAAATGITGVTFGAAFGFPAIVRGEGAGTIKLGMPTILSGRVAQLGISSRNAAEMAIARFNAAGGLDGRMVELIARDSKARPDEASRVTREFINSEKVDVIFNAEASSASFAVQEVVREAGILCVHNCSETSSLSADPQIRSWNTFRFARQGIHDAVGSAVYAAKIVKERGLKTWMGVSPDYAYGRDNTDLFFKILKRFAPDVEVIGLSWPKLFQPDYTEVITQILQRRPDAIYSALWGGDLSSFIDQAILYGLFSTSAFFTINLADYTTMSAVRDLPEGLHSGTRYIAAFPDTAANRAFDQAYSQAHDDHPTNWSWQNRVAVDFVLAAFKQVGGTDSRALAEALRGMTMDSFMGVGPGGTVTMRADDQTLVDYAIGWGTTVPEEPFVTGIVPADWDMVREIEAEWKAEQGYV